MTDKLNEKVAKTCKFDELLKGSTKFSKMNFKTYQRCINELANYMCGRLRARRKGRLFDELHKCKMVVEEIRNQRSDIVIGWQITCLGG